MMVFNMEELELMILAEMQNDKLLSLRDALENIVDECDAPRLYPRVLEVWNELIRRGISIPEPPDEGNWTEFRHHCMTQYVRTGAWNR